MQSAGTDLLDSTPSRTSTIRNVPQAVGLEPVCQSKADMSLRHSCSEAPSKDRQVAMLAGMKDQLMVQERQNAMNMRQGLRRGLAVSCSIGLDQQHANYQYCGHAVDMELYVDDGVRVRTKLPAMGFLRTRYLAPANKKTALISNLSLLFAVGLTVDVFHRRCLFKATFCDRIARPHLIIHSYHRTCDMEKRRTSMQNLFPTHRTIKSLTSRFADMQSADR
jgi:hypothetical protein